MYIALCVPIALSVFSIAAGFKRQTDTNKAPEPVPKLKPKLTQPRPQQAVHQEAKVKNISDPSITCPNCKKVFARPLVMLNFENGKQAGERLSLLQPYPRNRRKQTKRQ